MTILLRVAPWILFGIGQAFLGRAFAGPLAAIGVLIIIGLEVRRGATARELILDLTSLIYFVGFSALVLLAPTSGLIQFVAAGAQLIQGAVVGVCLLAGLPFTLPLARRSVPPEVGASADFFRFNQLLSGIWLIAFLVSGGVLIALAAADPSNTAAQIIVIVAGVAIPSLIQNRLVAMAFRRMEQQGAPSAA